MGRGGRPGAQAVRGRSHRHAVSGRRHRLRPCQDTVGERVWGQGAAGCATVWWGVVAEESAESAQEPAMSLQPAVMAPVPEETARVARAAFPKSTLAMRIRDELGAIFQDEMFAAVYPSCGQPALAPWRLALVTLMQFVESLPDRQAAEAVRSRIDWKYALGLDLCDPGFDFTVLSEFC